MTAPAVEAANLVECVANVSEGQNPQVIEGLADAVRRVRGAALLDVHSDVDHNRSVLTIAGRPRPVAEAAFRLAEAAVGAIDMRRHRGVHPRIGAADVLPFVPLGKTPMAACIQLAHRTGRRIAKALGVPVYFYGEAALREDRRLLSNVRRGDYEGLRVAIASDPSRAPDAGPTRMGPAGATAVGARRALVAFNVHLRTDDLAEAQSIARAVRSASGGLPGVQALGLRTSRPDITQVSMNLYNLEATPVHVAFARVLDEATRRGIELAESELVGLMPAQAALDAAASSLGLPPLAARQVLELALADRLASPLGG